MRTCSRVERSGEHYALGLCEKHYARKRRADGGERVQEQARRAQAKWRAANPDAVPRLNRKSTLARYGLTVEDYDRMIDAQQNRCAICMLETPGKALRVDHDHATGKVRGLLCDSCNNGLGRFKDSPAVLRQAAYYIEVHG